MKIFYIGVFRNDSRPALELCAEKDLSSFSRFTRQSVGEFLSFFSSTVAKGTGPGQRQSVDNPEQPAYRFHAYGREEGVAGVIVADAEYPELVAHGLLGKIVDEFLAKHPRTAFSDPSLRENACPLPQLKEYIVKYQDPSQADSIMKIQRELNETMEVMRVAIDKVVERGESLDSLVEKSGGLSTQAKMFYGQAKKQNSCCVVM